MGRRGEEIDGGVIDEDVDPAEMSCGLFHQRFTEIVRGKIAENPERFRRCLRLEACFGESGEGQTDAASAERNGGPIPFEAPVTRATLPDQFHI